MTTPPTQPRDEDVIRPLGAFERLYHRFTQRYSLHHTTVAEMNTRVGVDELRDALAVVQARHPLLSAHVTETPAGPVFARHRASVPVPVRVVEGRGVVTWCEVNAEEMALPFDPAAGPRVRVTLVHEAEHSTIVVAVDHRVVDGMAATFLLRDIITVLNGQALAARPVPPPQEDLINALVGGAPDRDERGGTDDEGARDLPPLPLLDPAVMLPHSGARPIVTSAALSGDVTAELIRRARAEGTTVHGAIVAAGGQALAQSRGLPVVKTLTPLDLRPLIGAAQDVVDHHTATITAIGEPEASDFWALARATTAELCVARSVAGVVAGSTAVRQYVGSHADIDTAVNFLGVLAFDLAVSNVKVFELPPDHTRRPTAVWGPTLLCQIRGETMIGVTTYEGRLRMVHVSHTPVAGFIDDVAGRLVHAARRLPGGR